MTNTKTSNTKDAVVMSDIAKMRRLRRKQRIETFKTIVIVSMIVACVSFVGGYHVGGKSANTTLNAVQSAYKSK